MLMASGDLALSLISHEVLEAAPLYEHWTTAALNKTFFRLALIPTYQAKPIYCLMLGGPWMSKEQLYCNSYT